MTDRGGGALLLPSMPAGVMGSDDDDDDPLLKAKGETPSSFFYCKRVSCAEVVKITMQHCSDKIVYTGILYMGNNDNQGRTEKLWISVA